MRIPLQSNSQERYIIIPVIGLLRVVNIRATQISGIFTEICYETLRFCSIPNDLRSVALSSVIMNGLERFIVAYIKSVILVTIDPYQFAYRENSMYVSFVWN